LFGFANPANLLYHYKIIPKTGMLLSSCLFV